MKVNVHSQNSKGWTDIAYTRPTRGDYDGAKSTITFHPNIIM